jgi:hypothetical protein
VSSKSIVHERFRSSHSDPSNIGRLFDPNDLDGSLNEVTGDKIRQYPTDYNYSVSNVISFICLLLIVRLGVYLFIDNRLDVYPCTIIYL